MPRCVPINNADVTLRENYFIFACLFSGERRLVNRVNRQMISLPNRWHAKSCKQRRLVTSRKRPSRLYGYILTRCSKCFSVFFSVTPQVLFAQDRFNVLLTVNVGDVSRDSYDIVQLTPTSMTFRAVVRSTEFTFSLELFDEIDVDNCQVKSWRVTYCLQAMSTNVLRSILFPGWHQTFASVCGLAQENLSTMAACSPRVQSMKLLRLTSSWTHRDNINWRKLFHCRDLPSYLPISIVLMFPLPTKTKTANQRPRPLRKLSPNPSTSPSVSC